MEERNGRCAQPGRRGGADEREQHLVRCTVQCTVRCIVRCIVRCMMATDTLEPVGGATGGMWDAGEGGVLNAGTEGL